ncbi:molybdopterin synthase sulfur carrier subunit [Thermococcus siculi]|uniref:Molybdopterin synthase sulfur carrier subunit n=1 Tax=Thermococcus siculi TaxID=72803 RepID=A0A2Z2MZ38_9EURY|nr:MoaD/ThiS family protein [Thermococcus siculi]ASJ09290.1 molybdopterin synthase sulfur carrier subunit [Thermococcus siculi]
MVRIRLMGGFRSLCRPRRLVVKVDGKKTVDELLREIIPRYDEFHDKIIMINGQPGDAEVEDTDEIKVMPVLSGG